MDRLRWTDDRLDDRFASVDRGLSRINGMPVRLAEVEAKLRSIAEDTQDCRTSVHALRDAWSTDKERQMTDRKSDRRWMVGTALTSAGLIIAALGVYAGVAG